MEANVCEMTRNCVMTTWPELICTSIWQHSPQSTLYSLYGKESWGLSDSFYLYRDDFSQRQTPQGAEIEKASRKWHLTG